MLLVVLRCSLTLLKKVLGFMEFQATPFLPPLNFFQGFQFYLEIEFRFLHSCISPTNFHSIVVKVLVALHFFAENLDP